MSIENKDEPAENPFAHVYYQDGRAENPLAGYELVGSYYKEVPTGVSLFIDVPAVGEVAQLLGDKTGKVHWHWVGYLPDSGKGDKGDLSAKITHGCEAAAKRSGLPAWMHSGVPEVFYNQMVRERNATYWGLPTEKELPDLVRKRMFMEGHVPGDRPVAKDKGLGQYLEYVGETAISTYKVAKIVHGIDGLIPDDPS